MAAPSMRTSLSSILKPIPRDDPRRKLLPRPREELDGGADAGAGLSSAPASPTLSLLRVRHVLRNLIHWLVYVVMHLLFSLYIRLRRARHAVSYTLSTVLFHHHRTPQLIQRDTAGLGKRPSHLSVVLSVDDETRVGPELERLVDEAADLAAWSACAGIPLLSIYEKTGILKKYLPQVHQHIVQKFHGYFGHAHPGLTVTAPHHESISSAGAPYRRDNPYISHVKLIFISSHDGRDTMVDLTRTLADMSQRGKLSPSDIQPDLIDTELCEGTFPEPDLLIIFGPYINLGGYPPWQLRLTEIFCLKDNEGVGYQVFLRALKNFSKAEMRLGK